MTGDIATKENTHTHTHTHAHNQQTLVACLFYFLTPLEQGNQLGTPTIKQTEKPPQTGGGRE